ncbi:MAG: hypothetical protein J4G09_12760 [Proteobacteria bacterium]|nr:hypothetical protein [Pseudomonadota bacterium]
MSKLRPGYGRACLAALAALEATDIVLFSDGDYAFEAAQAIRLLSCIVGGADLAIGSRTLGRTQAGALTRSQRFGNRVAEVPVDTRVRLGESKISGTLRGRVGAGVGILSTIAKLRWRQRSG